MSKRNTKQDVKIATQFINDFGDKQLSKRINAAQNVAFIGKILGNDRIARELVPFLREQILHDETPVVIKLLNQVYKLGKILGGGPNATCLFALLEDLIQSEEPKIRQKAIQQYYQVILIAQIKKSENLIVESLNRIWALDFIEAKEAFAFVVSRQLGSFSPPVQSAFLVKYQSMVDSDSVTLRRFASTNSSQLVKWIKVNESAILKIIEMLFKDKQQSNKIALVDTVIQLAKVKPPTALQPYFNLISYQFSWRVRYELIAKIQLLAENMGKQNFKSFLSYIVKYINDIEPEIRSISCIKLQQMTHYVEIEDIVNRVIPALKNLAQDSNSYVKHSLAASILHLCKPIGKKNTTDHILPKFLQLLKDQDEQVRLTIFKNVHLICEVLGVDTLSQSTMPALLELSAHTNWRIRAQSIGLLFYFISHSPKEFMDDKMIKLSIDFIRDRACSVRKQGIKLLVKILDHFQAPWFQKNIMTKLLNIFKATSFLQRQTILLATDGLMRYLSPEYVNKYVYPNVKELASDEVENVRLSSLPTLLTLAQVLPKQKQQIKKLIRKLSEEDSDKDVRQFATETLKQISQL